MNNNDMLSQEEIDALLNGSYESNTTNEDPVNDAQEAPPLEDYFSAFEIDALGEIGNISFSNSATTLSTLLNQKVEITTPSVKLVSRKSLENEFPSPHVAVSVKYVDGLEGLNLLIIHNYDAAVIADLMLGGDGSNPNEDLGELQLSAIQESMNQMMGSAATSLSTFFNRRIDISPPETVLLDLTAGQGIEYVPNEDILVKVSFNLKVGNLIDSSIMQILSVDFAKSYIGPLLHSAQTEVVNTKVEGMESSMNREKDKKENEYVENQQQEEHIMKQKLDFVEEAQFVEFDDDHSTRNKGHRNLDLLMDIPLNISVELGRTRKSIKEILELNTGSIVELDKLAGEPVDILINNQLIAKGEVVVIDENFGVRLTDIINQSERIKKLR